MNDAGRAPGDGPTGSGTDKASDHFVRCLEAEGVERIFGVPGEENADLMLSLQGSSIDFVLCRHEQAAAFMADAYGRLTGRAGVCLGTLGPGATNLVTGLADANLDRSPVVCIIGQGSTARLHKESHQNMDAIGMLRPVSKWAQSVQNEAVISEVVRKAFKLAQMEKPGVCVIELPEDVAKRPVDGPALPVYRTRRPAADHKAVTAALDLIAAAKQPLILAGNGSVRHRAVRQLRRFARKTGIGVVNTFMGKGGIPMSDPHCLFTMGLQSRDHISLAMDAADLVITIGYDLVEYAPEFWNRAGDKTIVHIDFLPAEVDRHYTVAVDVVADIADSLWQLNEELNRRFDSEDLLPLFDIGARAGLRQTILDDLTAERDDLAFPAKPQRILSDVGAHKMWIARHYQCEAPNTCLISNGFCSMGFALPGAIGAKFAHPDRRVLAICGDGGFLMNVQELETAARLGVNVVCMVWVDGGYGLIQWKQESQFQGRHSDLAFDNPDFELLARAFGIWGRSLTATEQVGPALEEAFAQDGPALIAIPVDYRENLKLSDRLGKLEVAI